MPGFTFIIFSVVNDEGRAEVDVGMVSQDTRRRDMSAVKSIRIFAAPFFNEKFLLMQTMPASSLHHQREDRMT